MFRLRTGNIDREFESLCIQERLHDDSRVAQKANMLSGVLPKRDTYDVTNVALELVRIMQDHGATPDDLNQALLRHEPSLTPEASFWDHVRAIEQEGREL